MKDFFTIVQSIITSAAIIIGGIWTYLLFVRQRLRFPKVNIDLHVYDTVLPEGARLIHVEIRITNVGSVIFRSDSAELRLRQMVPIPDELREPVEKGHDPVPNGETEIEWPMIAGRKWNWKKGEFEIEPGESDSIHADYIIPSIAQITEFYCFISNAKKKRKGTGWTITKIHEFNSYNLEENKK